MALTTRGTRKKKEKKEELLSLNNPQKDSSEDKDNFKSTSRGRRRNTTVADTIKKNNISDDEMDDIDRQIKKIEKQKSVTKKDVEKATGKKVVTKNGKPGIIFGKNAKFRPFGGVLARALLGDDEKFGGERGLIDFVRTKKKPVKKQAGGMMKAKGYSRGGLGMSNPSIKLSGGKKTRRSTPAPAPREEKLAAGRRAAAARAAAGYSQRTPSRAQSRATLSRAQRQLLDSVQGKEGSKQSTSVIQDLSDKYGFKPGKRAGAKGGMGKRKRAKPPGMQMGGMAMRSKMASKGGKMGGKVPPGYKNGGSVGRKKTARGVGAALRGYGKALK